MAQGIRMSSHARGGPDTEGGRSLPDTRSARSREAEPSSSEGS